jgi:hypothetical protein
MALPLFAALAAFGLPAPVAYWDFEDSSGSRLTDKGGRGLHGAVTGPLSPVPGRMGKAFDFAGSTHIQIPDSLALPQSFTFSAWVWQGSQTGDVPVLEFCCTEGYSGLHVWLNAEGATVAPGNVAFNLRPAPMPANAGANTARGTLTLNQWHHIVLTFDSLSRTAYLYADKSPRANFTFAGVGNRPTVSGPFYLGYRPSTSLDARRGVRYTGRLDEVRVYASALSQIQVDSLYALSTPDSPAPTPSDTALAVLPAPAAYWDFEDSTGTEAKDKSGNGAHGTITGGLGTAPGKWGKAFNFIGFNHVEIPDARLDLPGSFSFSFWIYQAAQSQDAPLLEFCCPGTYSGLHLWANTTGNSTIVPGALQLNLRPDPPNSAGFSTPANTLTESSWNHVVLTYDNFARAANLYVNKAHVNGLTLPPGSLPATTGSLYIGARSSSSSDARKGAHFTGRLDELRIYATALTQAQVNALYVLSPAKIPHPDSVIAHWNFDEGSGSVLHDVTLQGNDGTITGPAVWGTGVRGGALYFNGSTKVTIPGTSYLGAANASWSAWVKLDGPGDQLLMALQNASGWPYRRLWVSASQSAGVSRGLLLFDFENVQSASGAQVLSAASFVESGWRHVAVSHDNGTVELYLDGVLSKTQAFGTGPAGSSGPLHLGGGLTNGLGGFTGWMDEVHVYARPLKASEVAALQGAPSALRPPAAFSPLRWERVGPRAFRLGGLGEGVRARVDVLGPDGRVAVSWRDVREGDRLDVPAEAEGSARLVRVRTSGGKVLSFKAAWLRP